MSEVDEVITIDSVEDAKLFDFESETPTMAQIIDNNKNKRTRKAVVPPSVITSDMSVYDYLRSCNPPLDRKIIDIACSQTQVGPDLRDDAAQEIRIMWSNLKPDTKNYKPGQIASYAHHMARHAALRCRRELGSAVRLPGSAFRKRKDGGTYVTPGVLAQALDWNELESWFQTDGTGDNGDMSAPFGADALMGMVAESEASNEEDSEEATRAERMGVLEQFKDELSERQFGIMKGLVDGSSYEDIMASHHIKKGVLMREIAVASAIVGPLNF